MVPEVDSDFIQVELRLQTGTAPQVRDAIINRIEGELLAMNREVFITCAVTGSGATQDRSPHVPRSPEAIAASATDSGGPLKSSATASAGVSVVSRRDSRYRM